MIETLKLLDIDGEFIGLAIKTLVVILVITIILSAAVFYYREHYNREWQDIGHLGSKKSGFTDFNTNGNMPSTINYVLWIGDVITTLDILNLAQQPKTVVQPIYIPDPMNSLARTEYELQITRTLHKMINTKYMHSQVLPIISITKERPDDDAFNKEYDHSVDDGASDALTRENILHRWAKYYKLVITEPSSKTRMSSAAGTNSTNSTNKTKAQNNKNKAVKTIRNDKQKTDARILSETWNCRFPMGANGVQCGLCKKCEKLNSL